MHFQPSKRELAEFGVEIDMDHEELSASKTQSVCIFIWLSRMTADH